MIYINYRNGMIIINQRVEKKKKYFIKFRCFRKSKNLKLSKPSNSLKNIKKFKKFIISMNFECIICFDLCKNAISCLQCFKLMCLFHVSKFGNRCPHCRLEPFAYKQQKELSEQIEYHIYKEKEKMKSNNVFKCLVEGCGFQGKYSKMIDHRKSKHYNEKLEQILFPEERAKKKKREVLRKLFVTKQQPTAIHRQQALVLYAKTKGQCDFKKLINMVMHSELCQHPSCKRICISKDIIFVGDQNKHLSTCSEAQKLSHLF